MLISFWLEAGTLGCRPLTSASRRPLPSATLTLHLDCSSPSTRVTCRCSKGQLASTASLGRPTGGGAAGREAIGRERSGLGAGSAGALWAQAAMPMELLPPTTSSIAIARS